MYQEAKSCYLKSNDKTLSTVYLPNETKITVGRTRETNIKDLHCSKQQVELYANYKEYRIYITQLGKHPCGFNGYKTTRHVRFQAKHNDLLEILYGQYSYQIEFNPPPPKTSWSVEKTKVSNIYNEDEERFCKKPKLEDDNTVPSTHTGNIEKTPEKGQATDVSNCMSENETKSDELQGKDNLRDKCTDHSEETQEATRKVTNSTKNSGGILKFITKTNMAGSKDNSKDSNTEQYKWESYEKGLLLMYTMQDVKGRSKIAAFDLDGTLIKTKSGLVFPKHYDDWELIYHNVSAKLKELYNNDYKIVVFTNQASIGSGKLNANLFKNKLKNITGKINIPIQIFIATGHNIYRKPATGMWKKLEENNDSVPIDKTNSFYVGDAAGRPKNWAPGKKKDHSSADRLYALNLNLKFYTPEEFFLGHSQVPYNLPTFNPKNLSNTKTSTEDNIISKNQEVVLMVGCPGSGKSHFVKQYLKSYVHVNRDTLGSWQKCVDLVERSLTDKNSVAVDNTNPDCASRKRYIEVARKCGVPIRCFVMSTSIDHAKHNNKFRELTDPSHMKVSEIIINSYVKNYQEPNLEEGFTEIVHVPFVPKFSTEKDQQLYELYLLEG
ncbi:unnamed protein product [Xylocopa violacea]|uniref:PNK FHA domain-containing protein n=1 Tax=Xylocopa violacea TaxID=135666 RepID=A0ABP1NJ85_XYLVO